MSDGILHDFADIALEMCLSNERLANNSRLNLNLVRMWPIRSFHWSRFKANVNFSR